MADSRFAALSFWRGRWPLLQKISLFLTVFVAAISLTWGLKTEEMSVEATNALFLLLFAGGLWISEAIPPFAVSIFIIGFSIYFLDSTSLDVISTNWEKYISTWASPIIWILIGGFFLAIGAQITAFDKQFSRYILKSLGGNPQHLLLGCMAVTGCLSMFMSNTATTAMMVTILTPIVKKLDSDHPFIKALFLGLATSATIGGMGTVIGSPPNAIALGIIQNQGFEFDFLQWMIIGIPIALIVILITWVILKNTFDNSLSLNGLPDSSSEDVQPRNNSQNRIIVVLTFCLTIGLWLTSSLHNFPVAVVSFLPILFFTVTGVVRAQDLKLIPWDTLILVAGGLTLGIVIVDTGLDQMLISRIPVLNNVFIMILTMGWITTFLSNIMSNTAAASILIPVGASFLPDHTLLVSLVIGLSASTALFLPISTPPNAIVFSTGFLKQSDFRKLGLIVGIAGPVLITLLVYLYYGL